jgi:hypothetical protein
MSRVKLLRARGCLFVRAVGRRMRPWKTVVRLSCLSVAPGDATRTDRGRQLSRWPFRSLRACALRGRHIRRIGSRRHGCHYRALDTVLGHAVALKVIDPRAAANPNVQKRFLREARAAAQLRHAHVASVFYYGVRKSDGQCFYASELVEGETLEARMRRVGTLSIPEALKIVEQVTRALLAAEVQGVVHRESQAGKPGAHPWA